MKKIKILFASILLFASMVSLAATPTWVWYPGDYEVWLSNSVNTRRTEHGTFVLPFWRLSSHYSLVEFSKKLNLRNDEEVIIFTDGKYSVKLDGKLQLGEPNKLTIPAGKHSLNIKVYNQTNVPSIFVKGKTIASDSSWLVTFEDMEWTDASGKTSDQSGTVYTKVGYWNFNDTVAKPSQFKLPTSPMAPITVDHRKMRSIMVDFGKETFGYMKLHGLKGTGNITFYYGESPEEAIDMNRCETLDKVSVSHPQPKDFVVENSKAFRYVYLEFDGSIVFDNVSALYEYLPLEQRGSFRCNDEEVNRIWDVSAYTMELTTREFFIDGIKRDRWIWPGNAYQSFLMNYYLCFDSPSVTRTLFALRGKDPVASHINTIMDYTFYWFMGVYDYYLYSGDKRFLQQIYPRMSTLMNFVLERRNANGMLEGQNGDWVFIDWADFEMSKKGEVSFEQLLFCRSLEIMNLCADAIGKKADAADYMTLSQEMRKKIFDAFWSTRKGAFVHNRENEKQSAQVTPYTNMFAVVFDYLDEDKLYNVRYNVLRNQAALKITTPYMRFYEMEALCKMGEQNFVLEEIKNYWGGMLREGATSFWEKYDPNEKGEQHLAMYGRPYGRSLCHAWGASPIYLFGKYYLGVQPTNAGYSEFIIRPNLGGLKWIQGKVPTPNGLISVYMDVGTIRVSADNTGGGFLYFTSKKTPKTNYGIIEKVKGNEYRLMIDGHDLEYEIKY